MGAGFSLKSSPTQVPAAKGEGVPTEMGPQPGWDMADHGCPGSCGVSRYHMGGEMCGRH